MTSTVTNYKFNPTFGPVILVVRPLVAYVMMLKFRETSDKIIVYFTDSKILDVGDIQVAGNGLLDLCKRAAATAKRLVVDFSGVQVMSSAMIGKLVLLNKCAKTNSVDLRLANICRNVLDVFKITGVHKNFREDDDDPGLLGSTVPKPKPPSKLDGGAKPPTG